MKVIPADRRRRYEFDARVLMLRDAAQVLKEAGFSHDGTRTLFTDAKFTPKQQTSLRRAARFLITEMLREATLRDYTRNARGDPCTSEESYRVTDTGKKEEEEATATEECADHPQLGSYV